MQHLDGRTAVVIGGGSGVGSGVAMALAAAHAKVVVADIDPDSAAAIAEQLSHEGATAISAEVDSTDDNSLAALFDRASEEFGAIHILSNQCGVIDDSSVAAATNDDWSWYWEFNVMTMVRSVREALPHLRDHGDGGHIVTTSSVAGLAALGPKFTGGINTGPYTTTKHAVVGYSDMLRAELAPDGIGVTVLCPGLVAGNLGQTSARNRPALFGAPAAEVTGPQRLPSDEQPSNDSLAKAMAPEEAGRRVVAAIRADRAYCFTHPEILPLLTARFEARKHDLEQGAT